MERETLLAMQADPVLFRKLLVVPSARGQAPFGDIEADFQRKDFVVLDAAMLALSRGDIAECRRIFLCRTKGGSKDSDIALCLLWLLAFTRYTVRCRIGAADSQQADEIRQIIRGILRIDAPLNRALAELVQVQGSRIINKETESVCDILTCDAKGSHGGRVHLTIINELSHVSDGEGQEFCQTLADDADKVPSSVVIVASNAGYVGTWQEAWRNNAIASDRWYYSELCTPAPWIDPADLEESKRRNPAARYARLWEGVWGVNDGSAIEEEDLQASIVLEGPPASYSVVTNERRSALNVQPPSFAGLDLSTKRDRSALVVFAADTKLHCVQLRYCRTWKAPVDLAAIRTEVAGVARRFNCSVYADPWQASLMLADLRREHSINCVEVPFVGNALSEMATAVQTAWRDRRVQIWNDPELVTGLRRLSIIERPGGFGVRLVAPRDSSVGHCDAAIAASICLPFALRAAMRQQSATVSADFLADFRAINGLNPRERRWSDGPDRMNRIV